MPTDLVAGLLILFKAVEVSTASLHAAQARHLTLYGQRYCCTMYLSD